MFADCESGSSLPEIANSLRFDGTNDYLGRTPGSAGGRQKFTISTFTKRGKLSSSAPLFCAGTGTATEDRFMFAGGDSLLFDGYSGGSTVFLLNTTTLFRDTSAWYHLVASVDTTQATASNRVLLYVNGSQVTSFATATYPAQNALLNISNSIAHYIGTTPDPYYLDGYLSNVCFIDGQALTPSSFAYTDPNGQWRSLSKSALTALASAGGTNSFFLPFDNGASTTTLGYDASSKANNWTLNNMVRAAGPTECWMTDTPTNNFATLNPLDLYAGAVPSNGALSVTHTTSGGWGTFSIGSGKWYWETTSSTALTNGGAIGVRTGDNGADTYCIYRSTGLRDIDGSAVAYGATYTTNDVIGIALDMDGGTVTFYKNNVSQGAITYSRVGRLLRSFNGVIAGGTTETWHLNFGQRAFQYTPPTGFKALCTKNLPVPTGAAKEPKKHFDVLTHTGVNSTGDRVVSGAQFTPDFVWGKSRSPDAFSHQFYDSVRGVGKALSSDTTGAEITNSSSGYLSSFDSGGFSTLKGSGDNWYWNKLSTVYVDWLWKAGGAAVTNNSGSISSQVSANTEAGFSIVTYTGTGANATVGHGLGVAPKMVIVKRRDSGVDNWWVYHSGLTSAAYRLRLNTTDAQDSQSTGWNSTAPASTVFSVGSSTGTNGSAQTHVAYCFAEVAGFSKIGSYVGNGSADGPFVWCGFRPKFVMAKSSTGAEAWYMVDASRDAYNVTTYGLLPNSSVNESTGYNLDFTANGFKVRTSAVPLNTSGATYIFIAFAEAPFQYAGAR